MLFLKNDRQVTFYNRDMLRAFHQNLISPKMGERLFVTDIPDFKKNRAYAVYEQYSDFWL